MCMNKDFNQCQQSWWKIFELTTANSLFFNNLQKWRQRPGRVKVLPKGPFAKMFSGKVF